MKFDAFIGGSNPSGSPNVDIEHTVNLYLEAAGEGASAPKAQKVLYARPGLQLLATLPTSPVRGVWTNSTRIFAVAGSKLYELFVQQGVCSTNGTAVSYVSGTHFDNTNGVAGNKITIAGVTYAVGSYSSSSALTLGSTAGVQVAVAFTCVTWQLLGDVGNDGLPVQIFPNGNQILIVSAGSAYCDNGAAPVLATFTTSLSGTMQVTDVIGHPSVCHWVSGDTFPSTLAGVTITINGTSKTVASVDPSGKTMTLTVGSFAPLDPVAWSGAPAIGARTGAFLDGYFIVNPPDSKQINISAINDGTTWDAADFATKAGYPDNIQAVFADHEEVWLLGTDTTEVWQNTGAALFPLQRISGAFIHHGCGAIWSPTRLKEGVAWLEGEPGRGGCSAVYAQGFMPQRVSTHAVETVWNGYSTTADAVSHTYIEDGHEFWVIQFPTANATWIFDATAGTWTERGWWNGSSNDMQRVMFHAYSPAFRMHIGGDWSNGNVYWQSTAFLSDAGTDIVWSRTAPHLSEEQVWNFYSKFQIDLEVGQSTSSPLLSLSWSDDGGHTWSTPITGTPSDATYAGRIIWFALGRSRDRVFRLSGAVPQGGPRTALIQALLDLMQGIG